MTLREFSWARRWPADGAVTSIVAVVAVCAAMAGAAAHDPGTLRLLVALAYLVVLGWIAVYDARTLRAPNRVVYPAIAAGTAISLALGWSAALQAITGALVAFAVLLAIAIAGRGAMGYGDVKVGTIAGLAIGFKALPMLLLSTFALGGAFAAVMLALRLRDRKDAVAFTPFLALGVAICLAFGQGYLVR